MPSFNKKLLTPKNIIILWLAISFVYVVTGEYTRFTKTIAEPSYRSGKTDLALQLIAEAQKCKPLPLKFEDEQVNLMSLTCLQQLQQVNEKQSK